MSCEVSLRCQCGRLRGVAGNLAPETTLRCICYCRDCRGYAHFLERPDVLDGAGGTEIVQMARASLSIDTGLELLACVRLSRSGLFRWYASCCRTPVGNTVPNIPFVGLIHSIIDSGFDRDLLGAAALVNTGASLAPLPPHPRVPVRAVLKCLRLVSGWWLRDRKAPSVFFDASGTPAFVPTVLDGNQRDELSRHPRA